MVLVPQDNTRAAARAQLRGLKCPDRKDFGSTYQQSFWHQSKMISPLGSCPQRTRNSCVSAGATWTIAATYRSNVTTIMRRLWRPCGACRRLGSDGCRAGVPRAGASVEGDGTLCVPCYRG